jgi:hypothetical protein
MKITWLIAVMLPVDELVPPVEELLPVEEEPVPVEVVVDVCGFDPVRFNPAQPDTRAINKTIATARKFCAERALVGTTPFLLVDLEAAALGRVAGLVSLRWKAPDAAFRRLVEKTFA